MMTAMNLNINSMTVNALDLTNFDVIDDIGQSAECVIVVVGCDGTGSVGSSGDVIIGSGNDDDNNTNGGGDESGTLTVFKEVVCRESPPDRGVCAYAVTSANFPDPEDYPITVSGNNPNPSNFPGSSTGTPVTIGAGNYEITEELASTGALQAEVQGQGTSIITTTNAEGDCTANLGPNQNFLDATGTMTSGGSQECSIINTITISNGVVPRP